MLCALAGIALLAGLYMGCEKEEDKAKASISGVVTDKETGIPLSGVTLELVPTGQQAQTTEDGTYIVNRLKAGIYTVNARKEGYDEYVGEEIQLGVAQTLRLDIEMEESTPCALQGKVMDKKTGAPLSSVTIELQPGGRKVQTTEDGTYRLDSLKKRKSILKAQKEGYVDYIKEEIQLMAEETMQLDIEMEEPFVEFQITDEEGKPIEEIESYGTVCNFTIVNTGNIVGEWRIKTDADWLKFGYGENGSLTGTLAAGSSRTIKAKMDINKMQPDDEAEVILSSEQEQGDIRLKIIYKERPSYTETAFDLGMEMVYVSGGEFEMGATADQGNDNIDNNKPVRTIKLDSYYIGKYEVTQRQWRSVMGSDVPDHIYGNGKGEDYPVYYVSWNMAQEFCKKLSTQTGKKYVLPTEAMWEFAARGGVHATSTMYSGSDHFDDVAWCFENSCGIPVTDSNFGTHQMGTKKSNELGIFDMSGNVWEWNSEWYGDYDENDTDNPQGPEEGTNRVVRGGAWNISNIRCRVSSRDGVYPGDCRPDVGFRVACLPQ